MTRETCVCSGVLVCVGNAVPWRLCGGDVGPALDFVHPLNRRSRRLRVACCRSWCRCSWCRRGRCAQDEPCRGAIREDDLLPHRVEQPHRGLQPRQHLLHRGVHSRRGARVCVGRQVGSSACARVVQRGNKRRRRQRIFFSIFFRGYFRHVGALAQRLRGLRRCAATQAAASVAPKGTRGARARPLGIPRGDNECEGTKRGKRTGTERKGQRKGNRERERERGSVGERRGRERRGRKRRARDGPAPTRNRPARPARGRRQRSKNAGAGRPALLTHLFPAHGAFPAPDAGEARERHASEAGERGGRVRGKPEPIGNFGN